MDKLSAKLPGTLMVGKDGFSPLVEVSEIAGGHRVTVTDVRGVKTFDVLNGQDAKSAYDYAVEGGYTGDSAAFSEALLKALTTDETGNVDLSGSQYDLKDGYGYTEDVYIAADGSETALTGENYKCVDYIPVKTGVSYTMYGVGYALYDANKVFLSAFIDGSGENRIRAFTPVSGGYVRLTVKGEDICFARFCKTSEKYLEPCDYEDAPSPFYDPRIPCDVHLYGDSNSEGYGLDDPAKAWSNRLGALITGMAGSINSTRFNCFAVKSGDTTGAVLNDSGMVSFRAYTNSFTVMAQMVGEIAVTIDGVSQESLVSASNGTVVKAYDLTWGSHTIELNGVSGTNRVKAIATNKRRSFTNHAKYGTAAVTTLPSVSEGNIAMVMYGINDRMIGCGQFYATIHDFVRKCKASSILPYVFTPIPPRADGEAHTSYLQSINDVIAQLPRDCINVYKDLQLVQMLSGETIYSDNLHLNERGHKILYSIAAAKLQLAAANSELA